MPSTVPPRVLQISNIIAYVLLVTVNILANQGYFGPNNSDISKKYHTPLTPAGWAFSIWGVIFAFQGAAVIYAALPHGYTEDGWKAAAVSAIGYSWQLTWLFECSWLVTFPRESFTAFVFCAIFLFAGLFTIGGALGRIYTLTNTGSTRIVGGTIRRRDRMSPFVYALYAIPTSINTAWLSVASCLGLTVLASSQAMEQWHQNALASVLAAIVSALAVWLVLQHRDIVYGLTVIWALSAVIDAQQHVDIHNIDIVRYLSIGSIAILGVSCLYVTGKRYKERRAAAAAATQESLLGANAGNISTDVGIA